MLVFINTANQIAHYKNSILKMSTICHVRNKVKTERNFPLSTHWNLYVKFICKTPAAYIGNNILSVKKSLEV